MRNDDMRDHLASGEDGTGRGGATAIRLRARPERHLVRPTGSKRHVVFSLAVEAPGEAAERERRTLRLSLVLDRSGSMQGAPLTTAKRAMFTIVDSLDERDEVAVVIFDDRIDVLQAAAHVTPEVKQHIRQLLRLVEARGRTALHEGWLTGCRSIALDGPIADDPRLTRCLLLTDGQANVGQTDSESIAAEAGAIRERAGVGTSTLGFGPDYNERLLAPMAVAGGGQFHHVRDVHEITKALVGETSDLRRVAALRVRLEIEAQPGMRATPISMYPLGTSAPESTSSFLDLGDLLAGEERHVVLRFSFPHEDKAFTYAVRGRVVWTDSGGTHATEWATVTFAHGSQEACSDEPRDPAAMHWIGQHHAERAQYRAVELVAQGDTIGARELLQRVRQRITDYAGDDAELLDEIQMLHDLEEVLAARTLTTMETKEAYYDSHRRSRGHKDYRGSQS